MTEPVQQALDLLGIAHELTSQEKFADASSKLDEALDLIDGHFSTAMAPVAARERFERGHLLNSAGRPQSAVDLLRQAEKLARGARDADLLAQIESELTLTVSH